MKESGILRILKVSGISLLIGIGTLLILTAASAGIAIITDDPNTLILPLSLASLALSSIIMGVASVKLTDSEVMHPLISSVITSLIFIFLIFIMGLFFSDSLGLGIPLRILAYFLVLLLGILGGIIGKPRVKSVNRRIKHRLHR